MDERKQPKDSLSRADVLTGIGLGAAYIFFGLHEVGDDSIRAIAGYSALVGGAIFLAYVIIRCIEEYFWSKSESSHVEILNFIKKEVQDLISKRWVAIAFLIWFIFLYFGINLLNYYLPYDIPTSNSINVPSINGTFQLLCQQPSDIQARNYLLQGDLVICSTKFISQKFSLINGNLQIQMASPSTPLKLYSSTSVSYSNNTFRNYDFRYWFNETGIHTIVFTLSPNFPENISIGESLVIQFNVHSTNEISQSKNSQIYLFIILIGGSFGIFSGIYHLKKLYEEKSVKRG